MDINSSSLFFRVKSSTLPVKSFIARPWDSITFSSYMGLAKVGTVQEGNYSPGTPSGLLDPFVAPTVLLESQGIVLESPSLEYMLGIE